MLLLIRVLGTSPDYLRSLSPGEKICITDQYIYLMNNITVFLSYAHTGYTRHCVVQLNFYTQCSLLEFSVPTGGEKTVFGVVPIDTNRD